MSKKKVTQEEKKERMKKLMNEAISIADSAEAKLVEVRQLIAEEREEELRS